MLDKIAEQQKVIDSIEAELSVANATVKALRRKRDDSQAELARLIRASEEELPLFDSVSESSSDESWRDVPMSSLSGLSEGTIEKLREAELDTLGKIAEWCITKKLSDIPGVGEAKAESIELACENFWATRQAQSITTETENVSASAQPV